MITIPTLLIDKKRCLANIEMMAKKAAANQLTLRPHFKTHQSHLVGSWFRDFGITKITVSSLRMAAYFAQDGWNDITVAFPVNILEINTINELSSKIQLNLLVESLEAVEYIEKHLENPIKIFIKIDLGTNRTGIQPTDFQLIGKIISAFENSTKMQFAGFLGHAGHSYQAKGLEQIKAVHENSLEMMNLLFEKYKKQYPGICFSIGDTPTCSRMDSFGCATELRPGNFAFYDIMQEQIGSCTMEKIAVAMACPIVALHPERQEIVVYGGGVHFSKDSCIHSDYGLCYGLVVEDAGNSWGKPIPNVFLKKTSQEHGIVKCTNEFISNCKIGDILKILPVHSCMTMDLMRSQGEEAIQIV